MPKTRKLKIGNPFLLAAASFWLIGAAAVELQAYQVEVRANATAANAQSVATADPAVASGKNGAVATGSRPAADAGLKMLQDGGNAVDAAVATLLVQSVVEARLYCFGGEVPIIVYDAERDVVEVIAGLGAAPELATRQWFMENRDGVIQGRNDIANAVVPGTLDACITALDRFGTKTFAQCAESMLAILKQRSELDPEKIRSRRITDPKKFVDHHQNFYRMVQELCDAEKAAGTDRKLGLRAVNDYFYRGPVAKQISKWSEENGGLLRYSDFAKHHSRIDNPVAISFRDHTIYKCGPWTQGPFLHQTLRLIEDRPLESMQHQSDPYIHLVTEAMKLGFADRDAFYGDPEYVEVPMQALLSDQYTAIRRSLIGESASKQQDPGNPLSMEAHLGTAPQDYQTFSGHSDDTSNCLVADQWGNVVAATPSGWGGVTAGDSGVQLGSRMIGLTCWENHPSQILPGKRPRITLTPTLIMKNKKPVFAISVAGGDQQDQASIQIVLNRLVFGFDAQQAVQTSRFSTQHHINWFGHLPFEAGTLTLPNNVDQETFDLLQGRGHTVRRGRTAGRSVVLQIDSDGTKTAACDRGKNAAAY